MMWPMRIIPGALALLLLAGCSTPAPAATLAQTCEAVGAAWRDVGEGTDPARFAGIVTKLQAIHDAGDPTSREALAPVLEAVRSAGSGGAEAAGRMVAAYLPFLGKCAAAGVDMGSPSPSSSAPVTPATGCGPVGSNVVDLILGDSGRTAVASASARSGVGPWLVALRLRSGETGVWVTDSITDPSTVLSADAKAEEISGWGVAGPDEYGSAAAVEAARACVA